MSESATKRLIYCPVHGEVKPDTNHIVAQSRGGKNKDNVNKNTCPTCHQYYHWLFSNLTPDEIIGRLVKDFWDGQVEWVHVFLEEYETKGSEWPESEANWTPHTAEAKLRQILEGERWLRTQYRRLGLQTGDYVVVNERTKRVVRFAKRGAQQGREDLLDPPLEQHESIRAVFLSNPVLAES